MHFIPLQCQHYLHWTKAVVLFAVLQNKMICQDTQLLHMHKYKCHVKSCSTFYCRIWMGSSFLIPSQRYYCMLVFVCLFSIPHHLRHPYLNNTTPSSTQCVENIQLGSSEKTSGFFFFLFFFWSFGSTSVRGRRGGEKKNPHILSSCLERFINELDVPARNLFFLPPFSRHVLGKTPRQWFKLNGVCQTCQLIKRGFALSMHFSVTALFHRRSQLSTPSHSQ